MATIHDQTIIAFYRKEPSDDLAHTHVIYIKQSSENGEYAVKYADQNNKKTLYKTTQFLVVALSTMSLLMAEFGMGCQWNKL